ncbi:MAG: hypothetical protein ACK5JD_10950 [Mangrovibacterium sp.]
MAKMTIARQLKEKKDKTAYQLIAERCGVSVDFVGKIARAQREPKRGKGLAVKTELEAMVQTTNDSI